MNIELNARAHQAECDLQAVFSFVMYCLLITLSTWLVGSLSNLAFRRQKLVVRRINKTFLDSERRTGLKQKIRDNLEIFFASRPYHC